MRMLLAGLLALGLAAAVRPALAAGGATVLVTIDNFTFNPATVTVKPGTTVEWVNHDDIPHRVVADDDSFKSPALDTDDKYDQLFDAAGEYPYYCSIHPHMVGKVVVAP